MRRVLVTGATGYVGRHALEQLRGRFDVVVATARRIPHADGSHIQWHACDLLDASQVDRLIAGVRPTHLLHLAWYAVPGAFWRAPDNLAWLAASLHLSRRFVEAGGERMAFAGTCAEYDWQHGWCSEAVTPCAPTTLYGATKHALQVASAAFAASSGVPCAWGRVFFLYGPGEPASKLVAATIRSLLIGQEARCTAGLHVRDFMHVSDAAAGLVAMLDSTVEGSVNIASGDAVRIADLVTTIADRLGARELLRLGVLPTPPGEPPLLVADVRRLRSEVGFRPRFDLTSGIDDALAWWASRSGEPVA